MNQRKASDISARNVIAAAYSSPQPRVSRIKVNHSKIPSLTGMIKETQTKTKIISSNIKNSVKSSSLTEDNSCNLGSISDRTISIYAVNNTSSTTAPVKVKKLNLKGVLINSKSLCSTERICEEIHKNQSLSKTPSNGLVTVQSLYNSTKNPGYLESAGKSDTSRQSICSSPIDDHSSSHKVIKTSHIKTDTFKLNQELLEWKLSNAKLRNEISILNEKIKSMKQLLIMKNSENFYIKNKYDEIIDEYKKEVDRMKQKYSEYTKLKEDSQRINHCMKTTIHLLVDLIEVVIFSRKLTNAATTLQESSSSFLGDEDIFINVIDQLQGMLLTKLKRIKTIMNLDIEKEIEKVKCWSEVAKVSKTLQRNHSRNIVDDGINRYFKINPGFASNDLLDLSLGNQFFVQSPKFSDVQKISLSYDDKKDTKPDIYVQSQLTKNESFGDMSNTPDNDRKHAQTEFNVLNSSIRDLVTSDNICEYYTQENPLIILNSNNLDGEY